MAQGGVSSGALCITESSRLPSLPVAVDEEPRTDGESFNEDASGSGSEDTVPARERWWTEQAERFVDGKCRVGERWRRGMREILIGSIPAALERAGRARPSTPRAVTEADVRALKESSGWAPSTLKTDLIVLRGFLRGSGNPIAEAEEPWVTTHGAPVNRRWLTAQQLGALWCAARGRERLLVSLEGFNGLRRIEVLRLRVRDLDLTLPSPKMNVLGKGRDGGKWRTIPVQSIAYAALLDATQGLGGIDRIYPLHERTADHDIRAAAQRAGLGIRVSGHDLRRTFGRVAYHAGVSLVDLRYIYGHESVDMTAHYIGLDDAAARKGLESFGESMRAFVSTPAGAGA
jgi:integrase